MGVWIGKVRVRARVIVPPEVISVWLGINHNVKEELAKAEGLVVEDVCEVLRSEQDSEVVIKGDVEVRVEAGSLEEAKKVILDNLIKSRVMFVGMGGFGNWKGGDVVEFEVEDVELQEKK